jgi:hypothetical protein
MCFGCLKATFKLWLFYICWLAKSIKHFCFLWPLMLAHFHWNLQGLDPNLRPSWNKSCWRPYHHQHNTIYSPGHRRLIFSPHAEARWSDPDRIACAAMRRGDECDEEYCTSVFAAQFKEPADVVGAHTGRAPFRRGQWRGYFTCGLKVTPATSSSCRQDARVCMWLLWRRSFSSFLSLPAVDSGGVCVCVCPLLYCLLLLLCCGATIEEEESFLIWGLRSHCHRILSRPPLLHAALYPPPRYMQHWQSELTAMIR